MLRKIRIGISVILFALITFYFLDFAELLPNSFHRLAHIQFVPALLSLSVGILIILIVLSLLFGRIYCSTICPMGILQDIIARISKSTGKKYYAGAYWVQLSLLFYVNSLYYWVCLIHTVLSDELSPMYSNLYTY